MYKIITTVPLLVMMARGASNTNFNQISQNEMIYGTDEMPKLDTTFKNRLTDWYAGYKNRLKTARIRFDRIDNI